MSVASDVECKNDSAALAAPHPRTIGDIEAATDGGTPVVSVRSRSRTGEFGLLSVAAVIFAMLKGARGAEPNVTILDDDRITFKDLDHGKFELVTKEPIPRHIIVEDPGESVVVRKIGSSVSVNPVGNNPAQMEKLSADQQDVLANYAKGLGPNGSSAPPFSAPSSLQPINFIQSDDPQAVQHALAPLPVVVIPIIDIPIVHPPPAPPVPPTLNVLGGPTEIDTSVFDTFTTTSGTFTASSANGGALTFGIDGGTAGSTVLGGANYDVSQVGPFGTLYLNSATGAYVFVPNNDAINALQAPTTESFTITVSDGKLSANQAFTIAIDGANDAAHISGTSAASAIEAGGTANAIHGLPTASGMLTDTDVDNPPNTFTAVSSPTATTGGYGTFTITSAGVWAYTLNNANSAVQALNVGDTLTDTFTVTTIDGTPQVVTITIDGANDAAIISGVTTGSVTEPRCDEYSRPTATGTLTDTDVDNPSNTFAAVTCPTKSAGGYGTFTMTAAGVWIYMLDPNNYAVRALDGCDTLTDSFTVTTIDGTAQVVTITIHGAEDDDRHHDHWGTQPDTSADRLTVHETPQQDAIAPADDSGQTVPQSAGADTVDAGAKSAIAADNWAHGLSGHSQDDHFAYLSPDQGADRFSAAISDFRSKSDRVDLTAFGAATFVILALDSTSSSVPAHTIAWIYDGTANQTIVYVNPTDQVLTIGDTGLQEIHMQGFVTIEPSDFVFAPETVALVAAAEPDDLGWTAPAHHDATVVAMTTADISSDTVLAADHKWSVETTPFVHDFDADRDWIASFDHAGSTWDDKVATHSTQDASGDVVRSAASAQQSIKPQPVPHMENAFAPNQTTTLDNARPFTTGTGAVTAPSSATHGTGTTPSDAADDRAELHLGKHGWQFHFTWSDEDHKALITKSDGSTNNADGGHFSVSGTHGNTHGTGAFFFKSFSNSHVMSVAVWPGDASQFRHGVSGFDHGNAAARIGPEAAPTTEVSGQPSSGDIPDHPTSKFIPDVSHDLIV